MSWTAYVPNVPFEDLTLLVDFEPQPPLATAPLEQFEKARDLTIALIESGVAGGEGKFFNVSLSGHGNPGHEPTAGCWGNDCVTISVSQATVSA